MNSARLRIGIGSDFHLELRNSAAMPAVSELAGRVDLLLLGGDVAKGDRSVSAAASLAKELRVPVCFVAGNHEFYDGRYPKVLAQMRAAAEAQRVHFLENDCGVVAAESGNPCRILGATLWTDWQLRGNAEASAEKARRQMNDFRYIRTGDGSAYQRFLPGDASHLHAESVRFLEAALARPFSGPTIVLTHHAPSAASLAPGPAADLIDAAFASPLDRLLAGKGAPDLWIHGHTHHPVDWHAGDEGTRVVSNPRGYAGERLDFSWTIVEV